MPPMASAPRPLSVQLLGLEAGLILSTGLHILDWGPSSQHRPHHRPAAQPRPDTTGHR